MHRIIALFRHLRPREEHVACRVEDEEQAEEHLRDESSPIDENCAYAYHREDASQHAREIAPIVEPTW